MIQPGAAIEVSQFRELLQKPNNTFLNEKLAPLMDEIMREIIIDGKVDLSTFCNLVDLYTFMPKK
jgi:hypothetical protein